jgi:hypothetical protein
LSISLFFRLCLVWFVADEEEETYNIVAAHGYFGRLIFQYASFNNSRSLHFFLAAWPVVATLRNQIRTRRFSFSLSKCNLYLCNRFHGNQIQ